MWLLPECGQGQVVEAMIAIAREAKENLSVLKDAPQTTLGGPARRDPAARKPVLRWEPDKE